MPTYLTPGVYVEEVPSASKPIEGVSTSIAAFVGLAPGGPVNTPMRISNWTQFAKIFGDPNEPENGPFMDGAYLAHSVYGFFQNGGSLCWVVRVGDDGGGNAAAPRAALPAAADASVETFRVVALEAGNGDVKVELTEEPSAGEKDGDKTYKLVVSSGSEKEEHEGLTLKKGRANIATKVNSASKLIKVEETGASLPEAQRVPATGSYTLSKPSIQPDKVKPTHFEGDVARRQGMGGLAAVDEITMVVTSRAR
jgi:phage tail sheath protein FI